MRQYPLPAIHRFLAPLVLLLSVLTNTCGADDLLKPINQYVHNVWRTEEGLPQNSVQVILQTRDGYLWMGTEEGLVRFNGAQFTLFNKANTDAIHHNDVRSLMEDKDGNLWIGTFGGGVVRYRQGEFSTFTQKEGLSNNFVNALLQDHQGNIWIATNNGLNEFKEGKFIHVGKGNGLLDNTINALAEDPGGDLWLGTNHGVNQVHQSRFDAADVKASLAENVVRVLYVDHSGAVWIGTDQGLYTFRSDRLSHYNSAQKLPKAPILSMIQDEHGSLWVGTGGGGICRLDKLEPESRFGCYTSKQGLNGDTVLALYEDREKSVWAGTETGGLNRFKDGSLITYGAADGYEGAVRSIYEARDHTLWVALDTGLRRSKNGRVIPYLTPNGPANNYAWAVTEDREGNIWVGTNEGGLNVFTKHGLRTYTHRDGLPDDQIHAVYEDHAGNMWIGTERGGVSRFNHGRFTAYSTKDGLANNRVWTIFEDRNQTLWFGTDSGLSRFDHGKFTTFDLHDEQNGESATGGVMYVDEDRDHVLWIGTYGSGLKRLANGKLTTYTTRNGLFDDSVWAILEDDLDNLWMSSNRGIFRVKKSELTAFAEGRISRISSVSYGLSDGMQGTECNGGSQNSAWKTPTGTLLFACVRGIVAVTPGNLKSNPLPPPVVIESALVNRRDVLHEKRTDAIGKADLEFQFAGLSYVAPEKVTFQYKLEGFDQDWIAAGTRHVAYYTNIPAGQYTFRVIASNNDGVWNRTGEAFSFYIRPHFYQTDPFYVAGGLVFVLLCAGAFWARTGHLRKREKELVRLVDVRTQDLQEQISERIRIEDELKATAAIVESSHDAIWSSDMDRVILTWNEGAERLFGYSAKEATGKKISMLIPEGQQPRVDQNRAKLSTGLRIHHFETTVMSKGGIPRYVSLTLSPIYRQGKIVAISAIARDIESRKRAEQALQDAKQAAEAATRAKSEFLANMSHEIRTPLNGVLGTIELVNDTTLTPEQKELLEMAQTSANTLLVIINDILDFSKIEAGKLQFNCDRFDLSEAVAEAVRTVAVRAHQKRLELAYRIAPGVPQILLGDAHRLKQVLINLFGNAIKFTEHGEIILRVRTEGREDGKAILGFSVSDTGIGISAEQQQLIFRPFEQADASTTRRFGGTGLGLAISSRIVSMMGGTLSVESKLGQGSTFHFTASFAVVEHSVRGQEHDPAGVSALAVKDHAAGRAIRTKKLSVLLAEDNVVNQRLASRLLQNLGHSVVVAANGREALTQLEKRRFDVLLMDVQMPEMDGFAATTAIRQKEARTGDHCPIIAMTAHAMQGDKELCLAAGMDGYISKPITMQALMEVIESVLRQIGRRPVAVPENRAVSTGSLRTKTTSEPH